MTWPSFYSNFLPPFLNQFREMLFLYPHELEAEGRRSPSFTFRFKQNWTMVKNRLRQSNLNDVWVDIQPLCGDQESIQPGHSWIALVVRPSEWSPTHLQIHQRVGVDPIREASHFSCLSFPSLFFTWESYDIPVPTDTPHPTPSSPYHIQLFPKVVPFLTVIWTIHRGEKPFFGVQMVHHQNWDWENVYLASNHRHWPCIPKSQ